MMRKTFTWAAKLGISTVILFSLLYIIPFSNIAQALEKTSQKYIYFACLAFLTGQGLLSWRLMVLTDKNDLNLHFAKLLDVNFTTQFYKLFIPGGTITSILVRSYKLRQVGNRLDSVVSIILFDRLISTIGVFIGGFLFWCFHQDILPQNAPGICLAVFIAMGGLYTCIKIITTGFQFLTRWSPSGAIARKIRDRTNALLKFSPLTMREYLLVFTLTLSSHLAGVLVFVLLAESLSLHLSVVTLGWIRAAVILFTMLPVSFGGLGVRDSAMMYFFNLSDIPGHQALAMSFLVFIVTVVLGAVIGGLWELVTMMIKSDHRSG